MKDESNFSKQTKIKAHKLCIRFAGRKLFQG